MVVENIQYQQLSIESIHPIRCLLYRFFNTELSLIYLIRAILEWQLELYWSLNFNIIDHAVNNSMQIICDMQYSTEIVLFEKNDKNNNDLIAFNYWIWVIYGI